MAKRTKATTRTTITKSKKGGTTRTTITKSTSRPATKKVAREPITREAPRRTDGGVILGMIIILILLAIAAYFLFSPTLTLAQQRSQFSSQLSTMQSNNQNLSAFYVATAPTYQLPVNQSWSVQVTDQNPTNGTTVGQLTMSWSGQTHSLSIQNGIVNTGISPTYAVTLSHSDFMSLSQTIITRNTGAAVADYAYYYLSGKLKYTRVN